MTKRRVTRDADECEKCGTRLRATNRDTICDPCFKKENEQRIASAYRAAANRSVRTQWKMDYEVEFVKCVACGDPRMVPVLRRESYLHEHPFCLKCVVRGSMV